ncbi:K(+)-transporting ATPase subunit F [Streptomyces erythrochromogenes]
MPRRRVVRGASRPLLVALALLGYLVTALIRPEEF